jgi:hypothetical protein
MGLGTALIMNMVAWGLYTYSTCNVYEAVGRGKAFRAIVFLVFMLISHIAVVSAIETIQRVKDPCPVCAVQPEKGEK